MHAVRSLLLIAAALAQILASTAPGLFGIETSFGDAVAPFSTPLVPAGWAFSIWGLLFILSLVFVAWHAASRGNPAAARAGWLALIAYTGNAGFALYQPQFGPDLLSFAVLELVLLTAFLAALAGRAGAEAAAFHKVAAGALFALAGWVTVASPAGLSVALNMAGLFDVEGTASPGIRAVLFGWAPAALVFAWIARSWAYVVPIGWGIVGVAARNSADPVFALGILALGTAFFGVTAMARARAQSAA